MMNWFGIEFFFIVICVLRTSLTESRLRKRNGYDSRPAHYSHQQSSYIHETPPPPPPHHESPISNSKPSSSYFELRSSSSGGKSSGGYSIGSGLRSIAQGSANQAHSAVANQHAAAKQAAFIAKNALAQSASQAAATAQAALTGKQVILHELEQQAAEAHRSLERELEQLRSAKLADKLAQQTAQAAQNHVSVLMAAVNDAKGVADHAEQASSEVTNQHASQSAMVGQAKQKLEAVEEQLKSARIDYEATKEATLKAASSAAEAQVNASKAGASATIGLHENANQGHGQEEESTSFDEHVENSPDSHDDNREDIAYAHVEIHNNHGHSQ